MSKVSIIGIGMRTYGRGGYRLPRPGGKGYQYPRDHDPEIKIPS